MLPLPATAILQTLHSGQLTVQELLSQTLDRIAQQEPIVQAWEYLEPAVVMEQVEQIEPLVADMSDRLFNQRPRPLQGIPIAVKDIFATIDMPTGWGTPIHQGRMLGYDAAAVALLRRAGAIVLGKTVTTEYATARPGKTRNPHNSDHTPGGSSSGSAAAVAAGMVPVALGTQTMGSMLRPAAYCGVLGFKPSFGSISRYGVMPACRDLDHVGVFAQTIADIRLVCSVLARPDDRDPDCCGNPGLQQFSIDGNNSPSINAPLRIAVWKTPFWHLVEAEMQQRVLDCVALLQQSGNQVEAIELPAMFADCYEDTQTLMSVGLAVNHAADYQAHRDQFSVKMQQWMERGQQVAAIEYGQIRQKTVSYSQALSPVFAEFNAILTPVITGAAPDIHQDNTGSPIFCVLATLCGLPAISIPIGKAANGLPLAVQLIGQKYGDRELLGVAERVGEVMG